MRRDATFTVLAAPDKFRGSLTAAEAAEAIAAGVADVVPWAQTTRLPIADGGDGSVLACLSAGYTPVPVLTTGPLGNAVTARYARRDETAVIELAEASGLRLAGPSAQVVRYGSTAGTGLLIRHAVEAGARSIVLAVGGSATNDGGTGLVRALGVRFLDEAGAEVAPGAHGLGRIARIDSSGALPALRGIELTIATDVAVPLLGPSGAARQFAAQKGASQADIDEFEAGMGRLAAALRAETGVDVDAVPGAGAAGGVAASAIALLGASVRSGAEFFVDLLGFDHHIDRADLVVTGEGHVDEQTLAGKGPAEVAVRARGLPVLLVAGRISLTAQQLQSLPAVGWVAVTDLEPDPERQLADAGTLVRAATRVGLRRLGWNRKGRSLCDTDGAHRPRDAGVRSIQGL